MAFFHRSRIIENMHANRTYVTARSSRHREIIIAISSMRAEMVAFVRGQCRSLALHRARAPLFISAPRRARIAIENVLSRACARRRGLLLKR